MKMLNQKIAERASVRILSFAVTLAFFTLFCSMASSAYGLSVTSVSFHGEPDAVSCQPDELAWDIAIVFDANVGMDSFNNRIPDSNLQCVHLEGANAEKVEGWSVRTGTTVEERFVLYVELDNPLKPLHNYRVVIDSDLASADGADSLGVDYVTYFTTGPDTSIGYSVFQIAGITIAFIAVLIGLVLTAIREKRMRKR